MEEEGWRVESEEGDGDKIFLKYSVFNNSRGLIEKFYPLQGSDYKFLNYKDLIEN